MNKERMGNVIIVLVLFATYAAVIGYFYFTRVPEPSTTVDGRMAPEVIRETTVPVQVAEPIQVYKPAVKTKLKLPKAVIEDANKHVVAATKVKANDRPHTIVTTVDQTTGRFSTYDRVDTLPWLAVNNRTHIGAYYGLKNLEQIVRVQVQQEIVQTKALHIEAIASVDIGAGKPDPFIGIGGRISF